MTGIPWMDQYFLCFSESGLYIAIALEFKTKKNLKLRLYSRSVYSESEIEVP